MQTEWYARRHDVAMRLLLRRAIGPATEVFFKLGDARLSRLASAGFFLSCASFLLSSRFGDLTRTYFILTRVLKKRSAVIRQAKPNRVLLHGADDPLQPECHAGRLVRLILPFPLPPRRAIPRSQTLSFRFVRVEPNELTHPQFAVPGQLLTPRDAVALIQAHNFNGELGRPSSLPRLPCTKHGVPGVELYEHIRRKADARIFRIPVHELIAADAVDFAILERKNASKKRA